MDFFLQMAGDQTAQALCIRLDRTFPGVPSEIEKAAMQRAIARRTTDHLFDLPFNSLAGKILPGSSNVGDYSQRGVIPIMSSGQIRKARPSEVEWKAVSVRTGLGLGDGVAPLDEGEGPALLDGRGLLEPVRENAAQQALVQVHVIESLRDLQGVGGDEPEMQAHTRSRGHIKPG